jgi:hypothetical protein
MYEGESLEHSIRVIEVWISLLISHRMPAQ